MSDPTDHDQLFKAVIREFLPELLRLFFPDQAARFDLPAVELERFWGIIDTNATGRVRPVNKTRVQMAEERGMAEGLLRGLRAAVVELLEARFTSVPAELVERVNATTDPEALRRQLRTAATAADLAAFRTAVGL